MISIDFEKFNKAGLKAVTDRMDKAGLKVADVEGDNKAKRESGFQLKTAVISFESGQKLLLKAKAGGSIFQVKLNNKVMPIKHVDDMDKALQELIEFVQANEANYKKQKEKQLAAQKVLVPKVKPVNTTMAEQVSSLQASNAGNQAAVEALAVQVSELNAKNAEKTMVIGDLSAQFNGLIAEGEKLQEEYDQLSLGVAA
jgi:predicted phage tail protein